MLFYLKYYKFDQGYTLSKTAYIEAESLVELRKKLRKDKFLHGYNRIEVYSAKNQNGNWKDGIGEMRNWGNTGYTWNRFDFLKGSHQYEYKVMTDGTLGKKQKIW